MRNKRGATTSIIVIVILVIVTISYYKYPQYIEKSIQMVDINGIYVNPDYNGDRFNNKDINYSVRFSLQKKRYIFREAEVKGSVTLNNQRYEVLNTTKNGSVIILNRGEIGQMNSISMFTNNFDPIVMVSSDFVLAGPAITSAEAIRKYNELYILENGDSEQ